MNWHLILFPEVGLAKRLDFWVCFCIDLLISVTMMNLLVLIYIVCCFSQLGFDSTIELNCKNQNLEFIEDRNDFFFFGNKNNIWVLGTWYVFVGF